MEEQVKTIETQMAQVQDSLTETQNSVKELQAKFDNNKKQDDWSRLIDHKIDQLIELIKNQSQSRDKGTAVERSIAIEITSPLEGKGILSIPNGKPKEAGYQEQEPATLNKPYRDNNLLPRLELQFFEGRNPRSWVRKY